MGHFLTLSGGRQTVTTGALSTLLLVSLAGCGPTMSELFIKDEKPAAGQLLGSDPALIDIRNKTARLPAYNEAQLAKRSANEPVTGPVANGGRGVIKETRLSTGGAHTSAASSGRAATGKNLLTGEGEGEERTAITLDFNDVSLRSIVQVLFEEYLKVPYTILDKFSDKKVNFVFRANATRAELLSALESFLSFHGVSMTYSGGVYAISTEVNKLKGQPSMEQLGSVAGVFQLNYLASKEFLNIARQFIEQPQQATEIASANAVFVFAPSAQLKAVQMLHKRLDVPYFEGKYLIVYAPKFLSPAALKVLIENHEKMLGMGGGKASRGLFEVEAVKELGRVVIVAANQNARNLVMQFLNATDDESANKRRVFQHVLTNQNAAEVAGSINALVKALFNDETRAQVIADKASNSLFVSAKPEDFAEIHKIIRRLDFRPPAVHIDVTIVEVVLNDSMRYGVEWFLFRDSAGANTRTSAQLNLGQGLDTGLILDFINLQTDKFVTLDLLASETDFSILANPQMVVKNGSTSTIVVGSEIAIEKATLETNTAGSSTQTEFERRDVAIRVEATPTIGADQQIQIALRVVDERDIGRDINGQPIFAKRELKTELVADDGDTLFMGGIIRNRKVTARDKIPGVGDLKFIGEFFFGNQDITTERTELIMLVTPRLLLDNKGANILTNAIVGATLARLADPKDLQGL